MQGTFHLLAVLLAFIMGNLFAVHAENQKDLRTELAALEAIQWEVQRGDVRLGELGRTRVKPCLVAWADRPVETKVWQNLSTQESVLLLQDIQMRPNRSRAGDAQAATGSGTTVDPAKSARTGVALLAEIRSTYEDVAVAPELTAAITNAQSCARFMARLTAELKRLDNDLQQTIDELDGRYKRGQWVYSQPLWIYLLGLGVIWALYLLRGLFGPWRIPWRPRRTQG